MGSPESEPFSSNEITPFKFGKGLCLPTKEVVPMAGSYFRRKPLHHYLKPHRCPKNVTTSIRILAFVSISHILAMSTTNSALGALVLVPIFIAASAAVVALNSVVCCLLPTNLRRDC